MKRFYTFLTATTLTAASALAQVALPYSSGSFEESPGTAVDKNAWTQYDGGGSSSWVQTTRFRYNGLNPMNLNADGNYGSNDDWLTSPAFTTTPGNSYKITFAIKTQVEAEGVTTSVYFTGYDRIASDWAELYDSQDVGPLTTDYTEKSFTFVADETDDYYFAIRVQGPNKPIFVADVKIEEIAKTTDPEDPDKPDPQPGGDHDVCNGLQTPYSSTIAVSSSAFDEGWTVNNANDDSETWSPMSESSSSSSSSSQSPSGFSARYKYQNSNQADDYLISPAMHLDAGKEYIVMYGTRTNSASYQERLTLYASTSADPDAIKSATQLDKHEGGWTTFEERTIPFTPTATADYYFAFHCTSEKGAYYVFVSDFKVMENVFAPAPVTGLTATPGADRALSCTLSWVLPTKSVFGVDFTEEQTVEKIEIFRDGGETPIATLTEAATSFEDTEATGLASGKHTYSVVVTVAGAASAPASVSTKYVGPVAPAAVPCEFTCTSADDFEMFAVVDGAEKDHNNGWRYDKNSTYLHHASGTGSDVKIDDWIMSLPFAVTEPGYYRVTISAKLDYPGRPFYLEGAVGNAPTVEAMEVKRNDFAFTSSWADHYFDFYVAEAGTYYAGLHVYDQNHESANHFYVQSIKVETSSYIPGVVKNLSVVAAEDESLKVNVSWTNPMTSFAGSPIASIDYNVEVYLNDALYTTIVAADLTEEMSLEIPVEAPGKYTVTVKTLTADGTTAPAHPSVTSAWVGSKVVALPYSCKFNDSTDDTVGLWEAIDENADGKTWAINSDSYKLQLSADSEYISYYEEYYNYNDVLLSPIFELEPGNYRFTHEAGGGTSSKKFYYKVALVKVGEYTAANKQYVASKAFTVNSTLKTEQDFAMRVTEAGRYQIAIVVDETQTVNSDYDQLAIANPSMVFVPLLPGIATQLEVIPGENYALEATISWLNPSDTNQEGVSLAEGDIVKAVIYRNGEEIATVTNGLAPGTTTTYTDTEVPYAGNHKYKVEIHNANGCSEEEALVVTSPWIGGGLTIPEGTVGLSYGIYSSDNFDTWTFYNDSSYGKGWSTNGTYGLTITSTSNTPDAWAVSRKIQFEKNMIYEIEINSRYDFTPGSYLATPELYYGQGEDRSEYVKLGEWSIAATATNNNNSQTDKFLVVAVDPSEIVVLAEDGEGDTPGEGETQEGIKIPAGPLSLALHAKDKSSFYVRWFDIKKVGERIDTGVDGVSIDGEVSYQGGALSFNGEAAVEVYDLAGALVAAEPKAVDSYSLDKLAGGVYIVRVTPANGKTATMKIAK